MKKYIIEQARISSIGTGDYHVIYETDNLKEAIKMFNKVKHDKSGWTNTKHCYLETMLQEDKDNYLEPIKYEIIKF